MVTWWRATLSFVPCKSNAGPSGPLLKGADGQPIPSWGFVSKTSSFRASFIQPNFGKPQRQVPFWALISWESSESLCSRDQPSTVCLYGEGPNRHQTVFAHRFANCRIACSRSIGKTENPWFSPWQGEAFASKIPLHFGHGWCDAHPNPWSGTSHSHGQSSPSLCKILSPGENLRLHKRNSNVWNPPALFPCSKSPWVSTLHMVAKKDGSWLPCGD